MCYLQELKIRVENFSENGLLLGRDFDVRWESFNWLSSLTVFNNVNLKDNKYCRVPAICVRMTAFHLKICTAFKGKRQGAVTPERPQNINLRYHWDICFSKITENYFPFAIITRNKNKQTMNCHKVSLLLLIGASALELPQSPPTAVNPALFEIGFSIILPSLRRYLHFRLSNSNLLKYFSFPTQSCYMLHPTYFP
jgi:hypothetical protein